jgi:hypothetical protein
MFFHEDMGELSGVGIGSYIAQRILSNTIPDLNLLDGRKGPTPPNAIVCIL